MTPREIATTPAKWTPKTEFGRKFMALIESLSPEALRDIAIEVGVPASVFEHGDSPATPKDDSTLDGERIRSEVGEVAAQAPAWVRTVVKGNIRSVVQRTSPVHTDEPGGLLDTTGMVSLEDVLVRVRKVLTAHHGEVLDAYTHGVIETEIFDRLLSTGEESES